MVTRMVNRTDRRTARSGQLAEISIGGVGERLKPPVLKTGVHFVDREFESRPLRQSIAVSRCFADSGRFFISPAGDKEWENGSSSFQSATFSSALILLFALQSFFASPRVETISYS